MNTDNLFNQDKVMENIMLFAPMDTLFAIQDAYQQSIASDRHMDWTEEDVKSVPVRKSGRSRKSRRAVRIEQNKTHRGSDRAHGKRHGRKYLDNLPRKKFLEADNYDHFTFKVVNGKLTPIKDVKTAHMQFATM